MSLSPIVTLMLLSVTVDERGVEIEVSPGVPVDLVNLAQDAQSSAFELIQNPETIDEAKEIAASGKALAGLAKEGAQYFKPGNGDEGNFDKFTLRWRIDKEAAEGENPYLSATVQGLNGISPFGATGATAQIEKIGARVAKVRRMAENKKPDDPAVVPAGNWCWDDPRKVLEAIKLMHGRVVVENDSEKVTALLGEVYKSDPAASKIRFLTDPPEVVAAPAAPAAS